MEDTKSYIKVLVPHDIPLPMFGFGLNRGFHA